jgi:hypothetical protein
MQAFDADFFRTAQRIDKLAESRKRLAEIVPVMPFSNFPAPLSLFMRGGTLKSYLACGLDCEDSPALAALLDDSFTRCTHT